MKNHSRPRTIFLSKKVANYKSAMYQFDTISAFQKTIRPYFYGPGFPGYSPTDRIDDVIAKSSTSPDLLFEKAAASRELMVRETGGNISLTPAAYAKQLATKSTTVATGL